MSDFESLNPGLDGRKKQFHDDELDHLIGLQPTSGLSTELLAAVDETQRIIDDKTTEKGDPRGDVFSVGSRSQAQADEIQGGIDRLRDLPPFPLLKDGGVLDPNANPGEDLSDIYGPSGADPNKHPFQDDSDRQP